MTKIDSPPNKSGDYVLHTPKSDTHPSLTHKVKWDAEEGQWTGLVPYWLQRATHWSEQANPKG